jgi:hypothetical protein
VLSGVVTVAAQLQSFRTDVPSGRLATEMLVGLLVWEWGLPPLIVPAAERSFWRMLLDRHTAGDHGPVLGYCIARLAGLCGELGHVLSTDGQDAE